jgi:primosomal protein N' (replication factor Y)
MRSEGEVMAAALPAHFKLSSETILVFNDEYGDDFLHWTMMIFSSGSIIDKKGIKADRVQQVLDSSHVYPVINRLIQKRVVLCGKRWKQTYSPKKRLMF